MDVVWSDYNFREGRPFGLNRNHAEKDTMISVSALHQVRYILRSFPIAACVLDREPRYIAANQNYARLFNEELDNLVGNPMANFSPAQFIEHVHRDFRAFDAGETVPEHEIELASKKYLVSVGAIPAEHTGEIVAISVALTDITRLKEIEHELELANRILGDSLHKLTDISETDPLTGLRNRYAFERHIEREIARIKRAGTSIAAILMDVDFFKSYNDMYGHVEGDAGLQAVAKAIKRGARRTGDFVARYGGEEFIVILSDTDLRSAIDTANHIKDALAEFAMRHDGSPHQYLSMSMGVFCLPYVPFSLDTKWVREHILNGADQALYRAKADGRNAIHVADVEQLEVVKQKLAESA